MTHYTNESRHKNAEQYGQLTVLKAGVASLDKGAELSRRRFLEAAGFSLSLAALGGCGRAPVETALPAPVQPIGAIPGRLQHYASTCAGCEASCGLLVSARDGRPLKMEGLPEHPLSSGGLCAVGQAQPIELYDSHRLKSPLHAGIPAEWPEVDRQIIQALRQSNNNQQAVRLVSSTITSPALKASIAMFLEQFEDGKHVVFDPNSCSAILEAHRQTHTVRVLPHYRFDRADVIVSFGADFLGTWISPVEFTAAWSSRRAPSEEAPKMSYHVQLESRLSLTGSNADRRLAISPREQGPLVGRLTEKLAEMADTPLLESFAPKVSDHHESALSEIAERLWHVRGKSLIVCDSQEVAVQRLVNLANHLLGNYGATLDLQRPSLQRQGDDRDIELLIEDLEENRIGALLVAELDLLHEFPEHATLAEAVGRVPLTVSFSPRDDMFASLAKFVCPDHHALESWSDAEPISGLMSIAQPTLRPLRNSRALLECLAAWSDQPTTAYEAIRKHWEEVVFPLHRETASMQFIEFWEQALQNGFVQIERKANTIGEFQADAIRPLKVQPKTEGFSLVLYPKVGMPNARHAHNPWLQELPDAVTKVTWDNYVCVSPSDAEQLDLKDGDVIIVSAGDDEPQIALPALIQAGQAEGVLAIALAYGCRGTDRFANVGPQWFEAQPTGSGEEGLVGKNASGFVKFRNGQRQFVHHSVTLKKTGKQRELAATQQYHSLKLPLELAPHGAEEREVIEQTTLAAFARDRHAGAAQHHHDPDAQLWPEDHPKTGHAWGMVVDLNKCTGCSACVVACQSENNVPVVGYDEVRRHREMYWIRIDRYYTGEGDHTVVAHQPMMCQHCDNAPCETVCPVLATVHSSEGLNEQVYNRCVGTRYCANNCPYKVRRFNWFDYPHDDSLQNLVLNPDVTVRSRGVMEKCSMCVQRIEAGKVEARSLGQPVADGSIQTACQQSCPANAIVFGDMNDAASTIHATLENPRRFRVLEELNVRPAVSYLRVVKNSDEEVAHG